MIEASTIAGVLGDGTEEMSKVLNFETLFTWRMPSRTMRVESEHVA